MKYTSLHRTIAAIVLLISLIQFFKTAQPSVSFWDPGELSAAAAALEVPHPPGGPLFSLAGHILYMLPFGGSLGFRMNALSALCSGFAVFFLYLVAVRLIRYYKGRQPESLMDAMGTYLSAAIGALALSFCTTFWFNGTESNYFAASTFLYSLMVWLMLVWYEKYDQKWSWKYFLIIAYLIGLSIAVHLMSVLTIFTVVFVIVFRKYISDEAHFKKTALIFLGHALLLLVVAFAMWGSQTSSTPPSFEEYKQYDSNFRLIMIVLSIAYMAVFWKKIFNRNSFYLPLLIGGIALGIAYPGVVKKLPEFLVMLAGDNSTSGLIFLVVVLGGLGYLTYWAVKNDKTAVAVSAFGLVLTILGWTMYTMIIIRANQNPPMNENNPNSFSRLVTYLDREQYGDFPMFKRRWSGEPQHAETWQNYSSDLDFFLSYQMNHMFNRYVGWNFIGRAEPFEQDKGITLKTLFGIPFLLGLFGVYYHYKKDWKLATTLVILFIFMGWLTTFYQNQQQSQPRDREYFYAGAYFIFAVWIALGVRGILDFIESRWKDRSKAMPAYAAVLALAFVFVPVNMAYTNYRLHDRSQNWLPWDYSYNLLQSCAPNSILFTNGDNDTFPLWYLQDVEGVRRDVRIVNLSLVNTDWYIKQLKHQAPYGTPPVKISYSDELIERLQPMQWEPQKITLPIPHDRPEGMDNVDSTILAQGSITFTMPAAVHYGNVSAVRVQDLMVKDIVQQNAWQRPIYFATTCGPDSRIGIDDYLKMEGLTYKLVPQKRSTDRRSIALDPQLMTKNLLDSPAAPDKEYRPGFLFRGLNNKDINFDENENRLMINYRAAFYYLASYYLTETNDKAMCVKILDRMDEVMPRTIHNVNYQLDFNIALLYADAGAEKQFQDRLPTIEGSAIAAIDQNSNDINAYRILIELYERTTQYAKAADLLERLKTLYPNDPGLQQEITKYRKLAETRKDTAKK
jgi:hypothetical protein